MKLLSTCLLMLVSASATASAADKVTVLDRFTIESHLKDWAPAEGATIRIEQNAMRIDIPQYVPNDPNGWPRATRVMSELNLTEYNGVRVDISNPTDRVQPIAFGFRDAAGGQGLQSYLIHPGERRTLSLDFLNTPLSGPVNPSAIALMDLMTPFPGHEIVWLVHNVEFYTDSPQTTVAGLVRTSLEEISRLTSQMRSLPGWSTDLQARIESAVNGARTAIKDKGDLQQADIDLRTALAQLRTIKLSAEVQQPLVAWTVPLGTPFRPGEVMSSFTQPLDALRLYTASGQYEESQLRITNLTPATQDLLINVTGDQARAVSIRRNQSVRARDHSVIGDALMPLSADSTVTVGPHETIELWVRFDTRNHKVPAGEHTLAIELGDLRFGAWQKTTVPVTVTVRDFDLQSLPQSLRVQTWAPLFSSRSFIVHGQEHEALKNMFEYGVNIVHLYPEEIPWPKLTADGELAEPVNYVRHDEVIALMHTHGRPMVLYFMKMDDNAPHNWSLRSDLEPLSDAWKKGVRAWISDWAEHQKSLGLSTDEYALYFTDEPSESELDRYIAFGNIVRSINPDIKIYINTSHRYDNDSKNDELMRVTDIWQPDESVGFLADDTLLPFLQKYPDIDTWIYACKTGIRARRTNAHDYFRLMAWRAMRDGMTGIGYWSYCAAATPEENPWDGTGVSGSGAMLVYPGKDAPLASVRWELVRQAIDDSRYVQHLQHILSNNPTGDSRAVVEDLCGDRLRQIVDHPEDPSLVAQWRIDAGKAIEDWSAANQPSAGMR